MPTQNEKPNIALDTQYDSRSDVTTHSILYLYQLEETRIPQTEILFKWPFPGRHYLTPDDVSFLNRQALKILGKRK